MNRPRNTNPANNTERFDNNNRGYPNQNNNNNRFSRPRVNFIRAEGDNQNRYNHQRSNSFHEEEDRWRSREREDTRYNLPRRGNSLDDPERNMNRNQPSNSRTERSATTQGLPVGPDQDNNENENWVVVAEYPSHSILHNEPKNDGGSQIAQVNHILSLIHI